MDAPAIDVEVEGTPRKLKPVVRDEAYRIASEALRNSFRHAHAHRITVEIQYDKRHFRLQIRDDGKGFEQDIVPQAAGHFGLPGMRERAEIVGGRLEVWSKSAGTASRVSWCGCLRRFQAQVENHHWERAQRPSAMSFFGFAKEGRLDQLHWHLALTLAAFGL